MATSTLRAVVLVAFVAGGVVLMAKAFDGNPSEGLSSPAPATSPSVSPTGTSTSPAPTGSSPGTTPTSTVESPPVEGVVVQVRNGTESAGLAGSTSETLRAAGYTVREASNSEPVDQTTLYYRADSELAAQGLQQNYFPTSVLEPAPDGFPEDVNVTIVLGADYVAGATPTPTASATST